MHKLKSKVDTVEITIKMVFHPFFSLKSIFSSLSNNFAFTKITKLRSLGKERAIKRVNS